MSEYNEVRDKIGASVVRTTVPVIVGILLGAALKVGLHIDAAWVTEAVTAGVTAAYYGVARYLEVFVSSKWGWLLGKIGAPQYAAEHTV